MSVSVAPGGGATETPNPLAIEQPPVTAKTACAVAASVYGLTVEAMLLAGERDRNFLLRSEDGTRSVLKFYNTAENAALRDLQQAALLHLEEHGTSPVPRLIRTRDGGPDFVVTIDGVAQHGILISFMEGVPLGRVSASRSLRRKIGRACAVLDVALSTLAHAAAHRSLLWDLMQIKDLQPMIHSIRDHRRQRWITAFVDYFLADARPRLALCRSQTIHNDINTNNLLISADVPSVVSGIIDFGDMVHAPLVNEIGIAASYVAKPADNLFDVLGDVVDGFETRTRLAEAEVACLYDIVVARLVVRVLIYQWRSSLFPGNSDYILRNSDPAWAMIEAMMQRSPDEGRARVLDRWRSGAALSQ